MTEPTPPIPPQPATVPQPAPAAPAATPAQGLPPTHAAPPPGFESAGAAPLDVPGVPAELIPRPNFWQLPWVQNVLPFVTSLSLHAAIIIVGVLLAAGYQAVQAQKPLENQIIIPDAAIVEEGPPGGVQNIGLGEDPTKPPAQDEFPDGGTGWATKPGEKDATAALMGGGDADSTDNVISQSMPGGGFGRGAGIGSGTGDARGSGTGDGRGQLAPFGTPGGGGIGVKARFMGTGGNAQTVVFVCDASGSMINTFGSLKAELVKSISRLKPIQGFNVIFFQDEKCASLSDGLLFATPQNKDKAFKWLEMQNATGTTNPIPGIELAFRNKPQLIFLLTDAEFPDNKAVQATIRRLNASRQTRVNTIIFVQSDAGDTSASFIDLMKTIAKDNGGNFVHVKDSDLQ